MNQGNKTASLRIRVLVVAVIAAAFTAALTVALVARSTNAPGNSTVMAPALTPWASVGGCGAGGSGGGGGGAKWVGKGVSGGLIDVQLMYSNTFGQNFFNSSYSPRFSFKPRWDMTIGASIPFTSKIGEVQPTTLYKPQYFATGGMGDIGLDYSYSFGMEGQFSIGLAVSMPTGQYDIKRGDQNTGLILPSGLQKGTGMWNGSLSLGYTKDIEDGMWLFDLSYSNPFNVKFSGKNQFIDNEDDSRSYFDAYRNDKDNPRFYYHFKPYGENDLGDYTPPSVNLSVYRGYRGITGFVHSWGATFSAPFGIAWVHNEDFSARDGTSAYNPRPDTDHKCWNASLNYGMEISRPKLPLFVAVSLPIHDKGDVIGKWNPPDIKDLGQQWSLALGIKTTLF